MPFSYSPAVRWPGMPNALRILAGAQTYRDCETSSAFERKYPLADRGLAT